MRLRWTDWLLTAAMCAALPGAAMAEDEALRREMDEMRQMILQLQDTVSAQSGQIEQQRTVIERAGIEEVSLGGDGSESGISSFLQNVDINGWVSFTYFHNLEDLDNDDIIGGNSGAAGCCVPFAGTDDNSFTFQQLWFQMGKEATREDRAGFFAEIAFGRDAAILPGGNAGGFGGSNLYINSAYIEYLTTLGGQDILIKGGKFGTLIGYEVAQANANWNITRGNVYNLLQPIDHVGILLSTGWDNGVDFAVGVVNDPLPQSQPDFNNGKAILGHLGYTADSWSIALNGTWGNDTAGNEQPDLGIIDLVATWDPFDRLSLWLNADLVLRDDDATSDDPNAWGLAVAGRWAWTERLGTAIRWEFVDDDGREFTAHSGSGCSGLDTLGVTNVETECQIYSVTATVDFKLTQALTLKGEVRYDNADLHGISSETVFNDSDSPAGPGPGPGGGGGDDQLLVGFEALYEF
jgi:hypothetical protein